MVPDSTYSYSIQCLFWILNKPNLVLPSGDSIAIPLVYSTAGPTSILGPEGPKIWAQNYGGPKFYDTSLDS